MRTSRLVLLLCVLVLVAGGAFAFRFLLYPAPAVRLTYRVELADVVRRRLGAGATGQRVKELRSALLKQTMEGLRRRAEQTARGPRLRLQGEQIQIELPRLSAPGLETFKRRIARSVSFELRRVDDESELLRRMIAQHPPPPEITIKRNDYAAGDRTVSYVTLTSTVRQRLESYLSGLPEKLRPPPVRELVLGEGWGPHGRQTQYELYYLHRLPELTGEHVQSARSFRDETTGRHDVSVIFSPVGARRFEALTRATAGRRLAILLDGVVNSAPVVASAITGGKARITSGGFKDVITQRVEAEELAEALEAGALPAKLKLVRTEWL